MASAKPTYNVVSPAVAAKQGHNAGATILAADTASQKRMRGCSSRSPATQIAEREVAERRQRSTATILPSLPLKARRQE